MVSWSSGANGWWERRKPLQFQSLQFCCQFQESDSGRRSACVFYVSVQVFGGGGTHMDGAGVNTCKPPTVQPLRRTKAFRGLSCGRIFQLDWFWVERRNPADWVGSVWVRSCVDHSGGTLPKEIHNLTGRKIFPVLPMYHLNVFERLTSHRFVFESPSSEKKNNFCWLYHTHSEVCC